jgi:maleylacetate reductase
MIHTSGTHLFPAMDRVIFGTSAGDALAAEVKRLNKQRVFLMVSHTLNTATDEIHKLRLALGERYAGLYDSIPQHTSRQGAVSATRAALAVNADLIVAIGGGSVIDAAKIVLICMEHGIVEPEGLDGYEVKVAPGRAPLPPKFRPPSVRMIAIPSTLSGGEYNAGCLVTDEERKLKQTFFHPLLMPLAVILDPALTVHTPQTLWVGSGMRAMDHAIEAFCSVSGSPSVDASVLRGIEMMVGALPLSKQNPGDLEARLRCQVASWLCSVGLQARVPMGASHAIGHVLGGSCGVPHFLCTGVMMPSILRYNLPVTSEAQAELAKAMGHPRRTAADVLEQFVAALGLPTRLSAVAVAANQFPMIAKTTMREEIFIYSNPRTIRTWEEVVEILKLAA